MKNLKSSKRKHHFHKYKITFGEGKVGDRERTNYEAFYYTASHGGQHTKPLTFTISPIKIKHLSLRSGI